MSIATSTRPAAAPVAVARNAPRRRSVAQGLLALLLIAAGALTAGYVVQRVGSTHDFLAVARPVGAGAEISATDLVVVRVNDAAGLRPIPAADIDGVLGKHAVMALVPGTLLAQDQLTDEPVPRSGHQLVGLAMEENRIPGSRLFAGAAVQLVVLPERNAAAAGEAPTELVPPRTVEARIVDLTPGTTQGETLINIEVAIVDAATVAALAADDRIVIALAGN